MSIPSIRKFKISIKPESAKGQPDGNGGKTQGLKTGDIVRRQYFDGRNVIYSLMGVIDYGVDTKTVEEAVKGPDGSYVMISQDPVEYKTQTVQKQTPWFTGILLDGDVPLPGEVLDFVRITNLFDESRSGALYLTASDDESPFMDVIDGIGKNCSLTWPENIAGPDFEDPQSQYIVKGPGSVAYSQSDVERRRVCKIQRTGTGSLCLKQTFTQYVKHPNQVLVSFWAKSATAATYALSIDYEDGTVSDGSVNIEVGPDWKYYLYPVTIDNSGRHRRAVKISLDNLQSGKRFCVADFNAILLSSVANFGDASQIRVGKLTGISDPVFGQLDSYGGYFQKLFATTSAHISGTLTAGDENGFAATFYAGKIHKNAFVNSLTPEADISPLTDTALREVHKVINPTGVGCVFEITQPVTLIAQRYDWLHQAGNDRVGEKYTLSFWIYSKSGAQLTVKQNSHVIGSIQIPHERTQGWHRQKITFDLQDVDSVGDNVAFTLSPSFSPLTGDEADELEQASMLLTAPQLESGTQVTQYQPTDEVVAHLCEDYGAWFNRGGIGGTIQNPLIRLNYDGKGGIATRQSSPNDTPSIAFNQDGSGHIAKGHISWKSNGDTTLDKNVHLTWDNFGDEIKETIISNSIRIVGGDMFTILSDTDAENPSVDPSQINLSVEIEGVASTVSSYKWQYKNDGSWQDFAGNGTSSLTVLPVADYWQGSAKLEIRCIATIDGKQYSDSITVRKQVLTGYTIEVTSSNGVGFKNNTCTTVFTANVKYQGKPVDPDFAKSHFHFRWKKLDYQDGVFVEDTAFWGTPGTDGYIDPTQMSISVDYPISGLDKFICEMTDDTPAGFPYDLPIYFFE